MQTWPASHDLAPNRAADRIAVDVTWTLYMVRCSDGSLYTGITNDLERRLSMHDAGKGARYTRGRGPVTLVYREACADRSLASRREAAVKRLTRVAKHELVASFRPPRARRGKRPGRPPL
jgi:predicted GIY-YIG superfamily endonuclease